MNPFATKKAKSQTKQYVDRNPVEAITNIGSGVVRSLGNDLRKQLLGESLPETTNKHDMGDLQEGQELDLADLNQKKESHGKVDLEPGIDYRREILHGSERIKNQETQVLARQIESIVIELKRLAASSKELEIEFKDVVVEERIVKPGKYHQSFFEWMLIMIRNARIRVEDASAWLSVMHGKKNKRQSQNYWQMFKKHGTTFGLSNERVLATQTG